MLDKQYSTKEHQYTDYSNENYPAVTTKNYHPQVNKEELFLRGETNTLQNRYVAVIASDSNLPTLPCVKLSDDILVTDYTADRNFVTRLEAMSYAEAENLSNQIRQHLNEFPMPCMAITAKKIHESINKLLKQYSLTEEEQQYFTQLQQELTALAPLYPYKQSLIFVYKFLLCKSFIEYRFQMQVFNRLQTETTNKNFLLKKNILVVRRISNFTNNCTLKDILNLPWENMLEIDRNFGDALTKIYSSLVIRDKDYHDGKISRYPFSLDVALIPYPQELDIANINKTWALPSIWLVGCSLAETINADSFNMSSSGFFEHDLFHLSSKIEHTYTKEIYPKVLHWVKNIYQNKSIIESISAIKFTVVELVIFLITHEDASIGKCSNIKQTLMELSNNIALTGLEDLPVEYTGITYDDIRKTAKWLSFLPTTGYTNKEFAQAILELKANTNYIDFDKIPSSTYLHTVRVVKELPQAISEIIENVKYNRADIEQQGFSCSCIIANLRSYHKMHRNDGKDSLYPKFISKNIFLDEVFFKNEAQFTIEEYGSTIFK